MGIPLDYQVLFACNSESLLTVDGIINKISMISKLSETAINANNQKYVEAIHKLFEKEYLDFGINEEGYIAFKLSPVGRSQRTANFDAMLELMEHSESLFGGYRSQ